MQCVRGVRHFRTYSPLVYTTLAGGAAPPQTPPPTSYEYATDYHISINGGLTDEYMQSTRACIYARAITVLKCYYGSDVAEQIARLATARACAGGVVTCGECHCATGA